LKLRVWSLWFIVWPTPLLPSDESPSPLLHPLCFTITPTFPRLLQRVFVHKITPLMLSITRDCSQLYLGRERERERNIRRRVPQFQPSMPVIAFLNDECTTALRSFLIVIFSQSVTQRIPMAFAEAEDGVGRSGVCWNAQSRWDAFQPRYQDRFFFFRRDKCLLPFFSFQNPRNTSKSSKNDAIRIDTRLAASLWRHSRRHA
jgi:hypothetical protein